MVYYKATMSYQFSEIVIIYNPKSTGNSRVNAQKLKKELGEELKDTKVVLTATKHAGHAEKIGRQYGAKDKTLLVSSSGDGGYNELINGVLSVKNATATVCVLPSGNANDHFHAVEGDDVAKSIISGKTRQIDVLQITGTRDGKPWSRYAHSYIGAGVTAYIGKKLTEADLNPINEKWLVVKYLVKFGHVSLRVDSWNHTRFYRYGSFVIGNIDRMSKIITLDKESSITDGKFEVYAVLSRSFRGLLRALISASISGKKVNDRTSSISFVSKEKLEVQCDGEVSSLDAATEIVITNKQQSLRVVR